MPELSDKIELTRKGDKNPSEKVLKLGQKITDVIPHKLKGVTTDDAEYWGLANIVTDEMADIGLKMKLRTPYTLEQLVKMCKVKKEDIPHFEEVLVKMSYLGILEYDYGYHYDHNGKTAPNSERRYILPMFVPGSAELVNMEEVNENGKLVNNRIDEHPEVAPFFERMTFVPLAGITQLLGPGGNGVGMHVIPVEKAIDACQTSVDLEHLSYWLKKYEGHIGVGQCSCRASRAKLEEGCADDQWNWCIGVGDFADYCRETGKGHNISYEEAMQILKNAEDNGFVHQITNIDGENKIFGICNCNVNICNALRTSQLFNTPNLSKSAYTAKVEKDKCVACGRCVEYCPAGALKLGQKLCDKNGNEIKYPRQVLPDNIKWSEAMWNENYRDDARINTHATGTSPCKSACPAHIAVQGYLKMAKEGRYADALALIKKQNPFPAVCGRVCNKRCEDACTRGTIDAPVSIDAVKKFVADLELKQEKRYIPPVVIASNIHTHWEQKIAVIGGGPAGLTCAYYLATMGYKPTVFEKNEKAGGMLMYGIPSYKLEKNVVDAEIDVLRQLGVEIKCGVEVGKDVTIDELKKQGYQAFYIAIGCQGSRKLGVDGEDAHNIISAVDFLRDALGKQETKLDGDVVVIGGGNVAVDCARTSHRLTTHKVSMFSLEDRDHMPATNEEVKETLEEGIEVNNGWGPKEILKDDKGNVKAVVFKKCLRTIDPETHRFSPLYDENETMTVEAKHVVLAIGQAIEWGNLLKGTKVELRKNGAPLADNETYQTGDDDIFVGGDVYTGPRFAIDAIAAGKIAAESLHRRVHAHASMTIGRNKWQFISLDKENIKIGSYDTAGRQEAGMDETIDYKHSFKDAHKTLTEEQVKIETSRCLGCGMSIVDPNRCIGCGVCTTKCEFDAIHLERTHPQNTHMIKSEQKISGLLKYGIKRSARILFKKKTPEEKAAIKYIREYKKNKKAAKRA